jgi:hypothetical protein
VSYYGTDMDTAEASFDDPTAELEAGAEADDPEEGLGDGFDGRHRKRARSLENVDFIRTRTAKGI